MSGRIGRVGAIGIATVVLGAAACSDREKEGAPKADPRAEPPPVAAGMDGEAPAAKSVEVAKWLPTHQCPDGHWSAEEADRWVRGKREPGPLAQLHGKSSNDVAVTALATLAFLGAGYSPRAEGTFGVTVAWALHWLSSRQAADGSIAHAGERLWATNHALATWVLLAAAASAEGSLDLQRRAQSALMFAASSLRRKEPAWWEESGPGRLPPIVWLLFVRQKARPATEETAAVPAPWFPKLSNADADALRAAQADVGAWVEKPGEADGALARTAAGIRAKLALGLSNRDDAAIQAAAGRLAASPPTWDANARGVDFGLWLVGTGALFAAGGKSWTRWNAAMEGAIVDRQRRDGDACGSKGTWDPTGPWADEGGRVFSTAAGALALEVYYRYDKVFGERPVHSTTAERPPPPPPPPPEPSPHVYAPCR